jgi:hypothetical protein
VGVRVSAAPPASRPPRCALPACLLALPLLLAAGRPAGAQPLGAGIPADSHFYLHWRSEPGAGLMDRRFSGLRDALRASGFVDEYVRALGSGLSGERKEVFDIEARQWRKVLDGIDWWDLLRREVALGGRLGVGGQREWVFLARVGESRRDQLLYAFRDLLYWVSASLDQKSEMMIADRDGARTTVLYTLPAPQKPEEMWEVCVGGQGDVIALATSVGPAPLVYRAVPLVRRSLQLLEERSSELGLIYGEEYRRSRESLREGDGAPAGEPDSRLELLVRPARLYSSVREIAILQSFHFSARAAGDRLDCAYRIDIDADADGALGRALARRPPAADLLARVPRGVKAFQVCAGAEPSSLYEFFIELLEPLSGGARLPDELESLQQNLGFHLKEQLARHLSGRRTSLLYPRGAGAQGAGGAGERVILFELAGRDDSERREALERDLAKLAQLAVRLGLKVEEREIEGTAIRAQAVDLKAFLGVEALLGTAGEHLFLATAAEPLRAALAAQRGEAEGVLADPGFARLWKPPEGDLDSASYGGSEAACEAARSVLRLLGAIGVLLPGEGEPGLFKPLFLALARLEPAVAALDFIETGVSYTLRDGASYRGRSTMELRPVKKW